MSGPGVYVPDVTEGITRVEDLPQPRIKLRSRNFSCRRCPFCGGRGGRWGVASRTVHDLGDSLSGRPIELHICYSTHRCLACRRSFPADQSDLAPLQGHRIKIGGLGRMANSAFGGKLNLCGTCSHLCTMFVVYLVVDNKYNVYIR